MTGAHPNQALFRAENLIKFFRSEHGLLSSKRAPVRAVDGVSFAVRRGEHLGIVGESGCGKSTLARLSLGLIAPDSGTLTFAGEDARAARGAKLVALRRRMQIVFQDPYSSLNPLRTVEQTLVEPLRVHRLATGTAARARAAELLDQVGLAESALGQYPHEFSGGQRQRVCIARALAVGPELIFADEPVSALDVSVQAQVLLLLRQLSLERGLTFVFVSHDLGVVRWFCQRVAVMYLGRIVEEGPADAVLNAPRHPYTRMLRDASLAPDPRSRGRLPRVVGDIPSAAAPPSGCHFHPRCPAASETCRRTYPRWQPNEAHGFSCHHPLEPAGD